MKVDSNHRTLPFDTVRQKKSADVQSQPPARGSERADEVRVSREAHELAASRGPEVPDQARIDRLKDAIANGTFRIDVDRIASRMIDEET
jgi:flagellar biosynthesis anti-sigma factor FlgM